MKRVLCSVLICFGLLLWPNSVRGDRPTTSPFPGARTNVLVYWDGSAELAEIHEQALAGFAEYPAQLFVSETNDAAVFSDSLGLGQYDVFFALCLDRAAVGQWAADVQNGFSDFISFTYEPGAAQNIVVDMIFQKRLDAPPPPLGFSPSTWVWDLTPWSLEQMEAIAFGSVAFQTQQQVVIVGQTQPDPSWWDALKAWWDLVYGEGREFAITVLADVAYVLKDCEHTEFTITFEGEVNIYIFKGKVKGKVKTNGTDAAKMAERMADLLNGKKKTQ